MGVHDCVSDIAGRGPLMQSLRDADYFVRLFLEGGAPTWPNGYDMCPDWLRMTMEASGELTAAAAE